MSEPETYNRIRELRKTLGLTAKNLADRVGTTEATISRIESGKQNLSQSWLQRISQALKVKIADLIFDPFGEASNYAPVIAEIREGFWCDDPIKFIEDVYPMPIVIETEKGLIVVAFECSEPSVGWVIAIHVNKLQAANHIGKQFVVWRHDQNDMSEISLRKLEHREQGLYLVSERGELPQHAVRLDDELVMQAWRVIATYLTH
jgi:transcriptional regulator with XRE-family HTH domain